MRLAAIGSAVLVIGVAGALVNLWARDAYPAQWGGPNVGGGMLQLLIYGGALAGAFLLVTGFVKHRGDRAP